MTYRVIVFNSIVAISKLNHIDQCISGKNFWFCWLLNYCFPTSILTRSIPLLRRPRERVQSPIFTMVEPRTCSRFCSPFSAPPTPPPSILLPPLHSFSISLSKITPLTAAYTFASSLIFQMSLGSGESSLHLQHQTYILLLHYCDLEVLI